MKGLTRQFVFPLAVLKKKTLCYFLCFLDCGTLLYRMDKRSIVLGITVMVDGHRPCSSM
jgi:hypothetical protein